MNWTAVGIAAAVVTAVAAAGVAAVTTGWLPPTRRKRILRPKLWGASLLLIAFGLAFFLFLGPLGGTPSRHPYLPFLGIGVNFAGLALQLLAQRPGRPPLPPTTIAS
ncbi:hypothetical protein G9272_29230 [Streptomyces asoensis]|uniref:Uncharacterized protein n=1 Tax=Streptomyces asoensis TaxID=249586 RepID=A0A6M4WUU8_9ACTN|nr:hypothetical protein [Streptomyces asoensis]QJT03859.1 hypothetical protein G9272_29230 [Streptomyces asoensis]